MSHFSSQQCQLLTMLCSHLDMQVAVIGSQVLLCSGNESCVNLEAITEKGQR